VRLGFGCAVGKPDLIVGAAWLRFLSAWSWVINESPPVAR
jgi:hypothetical protein